MKTVYSAIVIAIIAVALYFYQFNGNLSDAQSDWAAFGGYIAGIAAIVNVVVFVSLTTTIQNADKEQKERDKIHQRNLLITQLRESELSNLSNILNGATDLSMNEFQHFRIIRANRYLQTFNGSRKILFPILNDVKIQKIILDLIRTMNSIEDELKKTSGLNEYGIPESAPKPIDIEVFKPVILKFDTLKYSLVSELEQFILNEIDK